MDGTIYPKGDGSVTFKNGEIIMVRDVTTGKWYLGRINLGFRSYTGKYRFIVKAFGQWTRVVSEMDISKRWA